MCGTVEKTVLEYIVRDLDENMFEARKTILRHIEKVINEKYGEGTAILEIVDQYQNMKEQILPCMHLIENALEAARRCGIEPVIEPIRGGTDGARLSFMGLPCPNLGYGGYAAHGETEYADVEGMTSVVRIIIHIINSFIPENFSCDQKFK